MLVRYQLFITYMLLLVNVSFFLVNIPTLQWRAVHFTLKYVMKSYLNHTLTA